MGVRRGRSRRLSRWPFLPPCSSPALRWPPATKAWARAPPNRARPRPRRPRGPSPAPRLPSRGRGRADAAKYEVRVYRGSKQLLEKTGLGKKKRSWKSSMALPANVGLTWKVRARNARGAGAWSKSLKFTIVAAQPRARPSPPSASRPRPPPGSSTRPAHTIAVSVPFGTNVTALVATFTTTGASVTIGGTSQTSGVTANNFSNPVTYTVTAADASTQAYVVTVTVAREPRQGHHCLQLQRPRPPPGSSTTDHTVAVTVPYGTDVTALVATFTTTGASVSGRRHVADQRGDGQRLQQPRHLHRHGRRRLHPGLRGHGDGRRPRAQIGDAYQGGLIAYLDGTRTHTD